MPQSPPIEFMADGFRINGPKVEGSWSITYTVGEYEAHKLKPYMDIPSLKMLKIRVEVAE